MFSLEFTIFSYTVMYLVPAPPHPSSSKNAKHFFCPLGTVISRRNPGNDSYVIFGGGGGRRGGACIIMYWGFTYLEGKFELANAASMSE